MARYIDADKLTDKLEELQFDAPVMTPVMKIYNVIELVEDQPTADVVEVKHGEWKHECLECSVCKRNISEICDADSYLTSDIEYELRFCPFCGAKMDGGKAE